jgi:hypothetical protein
MTILLQGNLHNKDMKMVNRPSHGNLEDVVFACTGLNRLTITCRVSIHMVLFQRYWQIVHIASICRSAIFCVVELLISDQQVAGMAAQKSRPLSYVGSGLIKSIENTFMKFYCHFESTFFQPHRKKSRYTRLKNRK